MPNEIILPRCFLWRNKKIIYDNQPNYHTLRFGFSKLLEQLVAKYLPGPSCSKLTMSSVNNSLKLNRMIRKYAVQKLLTFFSAKNIRILYIESAKTVNEMTLTSSLSYDALNNWAQMRIIKKIKKMTS